MNLYFTVTTDSKWLICMVEDNKHTLRFNLQISNDGNTPFVTEAVRRKLEELLEKALQDIRAESYECGWNDAKRKNKKRTQFYSSFRSDVIGY